MTREHRTMLAALALSFAFGTLISFSLEAVRVSAPGATAARTTARTAPDANKSGSSSERWVVF